MILTTWILTYLLTYGLTNGHWYLLSRYRDWKWLWIWTENSCFQDKKVVRIKMSFLNLFDKSNYFSENCNISNSNEKHSSIICINDPSQKLTNNLLIINQTSTLFWTRQKIASQNQVSRLKIWKILSNENSPKSLNLNNWIY